MCVCGTVEDEKPVQSGSGPKTAENERKDMQYLPAAQTSFRVLREEKKGKGRHQDVCVPLLHGLCEEGEQE